MIKNYLPQILIFVGLIFTFLGGFISFKRDKTLQEYNSKLLIENKSMLEENIHLSDTINNNIIGGNSFGIIYPLSILNNNEYIHILYFKNEGEFPLSDIKIDTFNPDNFKNKNRSDWRATTEDIKLHSNENLGNIPVHSGTTFGISFKVNEGEIIKRRFMISAKNGMFGETLLMTKINGNISCALRINTISRKEGEKSKIVYEKITDNFPRNSVGEIDWN